MTRQKSKLNEYKAMMAKKVPHFCHSPIELRNTLCLDLTYYGKGNLSWLFRITK